MAELISEASNNDSLFVEQDQFQETVANIVEFVKNKDGEIVEECKTYTDNAISNLPQQLEGMMRNLLQDMAKTLTETIKSQSNDASNSYKTYIDDAMAGLSQQMAGLSQQIARVAADMQTALKEIQVVKESMSKCPIERCEVIKALCGCVNKQC